MNDVELHLIHDQVTRTSGKILFPYNFTNLSIVLILQSFTDLSSSTYHTRLIFNPQTIFSPIGSLHIIRNPFTSGDYNNNNQYNKLMQWLIHVPIVTISLTSCLHCGTEDILIYCPIYLSIVI